MKSSVLSPPLDIIKSIEIKNIHGRPYIYNDQLFLITEDAKLLVLNLECETIWEKVLCKDYQLGSSEGMLLFYNNLALTSIEDRLIIFDIKNGNIEELSITENFTLGEGVVIDNLLFFHKLSDEDSFVCVAFDIRDKKTIWEIETYEISSYLTGDKNIILISDNKDSISGFNTNNGKKIWEFTFQGADCLSMPRLFKQEAFINLSDGQIIKLNSTNGDIIWKTQSNSNANNLTLNSDGNIYLIDYSHYFCLDQNTGKIIKRIHLFNDFKENGIYIPTQLTISDTHIYFADVKSGKLASISKENGKIDWVYTCKSSIPLYNIMLIADKKLFVVDMDGNLYVFKESR